ncbi:LysE/ArgO family amino acid transporter [Cellulomonas shaoxiangyii]|uniref:Amino acid transporter n=1 Tax=Cellulomonas shaoxiangyii TaxID=2566013 RepID=A0A4P7SN53_9CELL|nr:LysE/ArgO family amino acid transporter [Cellulomonas shaoxiangyii]QCB94957.1 amino acid transporter [Cellulomonas shaoxiangyii]TGY82041.1 amino acid transporter [Cellulomonas shaoxiangyii]
MGWTAALAGAGFGFALIVAIGAQNAHVLRQGLRREHVGLVVAICALSDVVLIAVGTAGVGAVIAASRAVTVVVTVLGALVLLGYAAVAARRAARPAALVAEEGGAALSTGAAVATTLALTWLNPHVYLDTVVLLGSVATGHGDGRWWFALGAAVASVVWFTGLGFGAAALRPLFARPGAWRVLDSVIALVMVAIAVTLVVDLL